MSAESLPPCARATKNVQTTRAAVNRNLLILKNQYSNLIFIVPDGRLAIEKTIEWFLIIVQQFLFNVQHSKAPLLTGHNFCACKGNDLKRNYTIFL
jgi:hypothetical protein